MHPSLTIFCAILCCNCEYCTLNLTLKLLDNPFIGFLSPFQLKASLPHLRRTKKKNQQAFYLGAFISVCCCFMF